jgi:hypothetical protein
MTKPLDQTTLKDVLRYLPTTGNFYWLRPNPFARRVKAGDIAGRTIQNGYVQICIDGTYYLAHRLAFLYMTGSFPAQMVDHINGNPRDNRWANLREVSAKQNSQNAALSRTNKSGVVGVYWKPQIGKWIATIRLAGKVTHLGCFDDIAAAAAVRKTAEQQLGYHPNHGRKK